MTPRVFILLICVCLIGSNGLILSPVLTAIADDFNASISQTSRAIAAYGIGTAISAMVLGRYIERFGYLRSLSLAIICAGLAQIISAYTQGWITLTTMQFIAGLASGIALPSIYALTSKIAPKGREAKTLGIVVFGWSVALIAAIPAGTFLADALGWRAMLIALGCLLLIAVIPLTVFKGLAPAQKDLKTTSLLAALRMPGAIAIYAISALFLGGFYGTYAFTGAHVVQGFSSTITQAGYIGLTYGIGFGIGAANAGLIDRFGQGRALPICLIIGATTLIASAYATNFTQFLFIFAAFGFINSFIVNMIVIRVGHLSPTAKGTALGMYTTVGYLGVTLSTLAFGEIYDGYGFAYVALTAAVFFMLAATLTSKK